MTIALILLIIALVNFTLDAVGVVVSRINLQSAGLAFLTGSLLVGGHSL